MPVIEKMSWEQFNNHVEKIVHTINQYGAKYKTIYAIPRGGLVLGTCLSHKLNIPMVFNESEINDATLICDDICDSGNTLHKLQIRTGLYSDVAVIVLNPDTKYNVDYLGYFNKNKNWIQFPYENDPVLDTVSEVKING